MEEGQLSMSFGVICPHCGKDTSKPPKRKSLSKLEILRRFRRVLHEYPKFAATSAASQDAAAFINEFAPDGRTKVLCYLASLGAEGATDDEGAAALKMYRYTYAPRRTELEQVGLVFDTGRTKPTGRGRGKTEATVWAAVPVALAEWELSHDGSWG